MSDLQNAKGPAATAIAPDHGSTIPGKEKEMNTEQPITALDGRPACCVTIDQIDKMTMSERRSYYDALRLAESALGGIICQPRFIVERSHSLNAAGETVDALHDFLLRSIDLLIKRTRDVQPTDVHEAENKAWIILMYEAECSDALPAFVTVAAQQAAALSEAEFHARHGGRQQ